MNRQVAKGAKEGRDCKAKEMLSEGRFSIALT